MSKLLDVAQVERGDGRWTSGLEVESLQCALTSGLAALCLPGPADNLGGAGDGSPSGNSINVFGVVARLRQPTMCRTSDPQAVVRSAVEAEAEKALGRAVWFGGTTDADVWFGSEGAHSVGGTPTVGELLDTWYNRTVGIEPIIHLGMKAASDLGASFNNEGRLAAFPDIPVVVNPSYPVSGMAVSGPIDVWIGSIETIQAHSWAINREQTEANALVGVAFDPCAVVIAGALPDQIYIAAESAPRTITVWIKGTSATATVSWGDATADGSLAAAPTDPSSASHTYASSGTYTVTVTSEGGTSTFSVTV